MPREMTPEERFERIERTLEFVAGQQAQFFSELQELKALTHTQAERIAMNSEQIHELKELALLHERQLAGIASRIDQQTERMEKLQLALEHTGERFDRHIEESREDRRLLRALLDRLGGTQP